MFKPYEKPEAEVKADPFSLDALIAWLRTKPAEGQYCYTDADHCLIAQFTGQTLKSYLIDAVTFPGAKEVAGYSPHTFGAALSRALKLRRGE